MQKHFRRIPQQFVSDNSLDQTNFCHFKKITELHQSLQLLTIQQQTDKLKDMYKYLRNHYVQCFMIGTVYV
jgi:hypothetical protein